MIGCAQAATLNERWHLTEPFKLIFRTTGAAETVTIPCQNAGVFRAWIDWGDGSAKSEITAYNSAKLAHVYAVAGDYTVSITGSFPGIKFNNAGDKDKLREVVAWGKTNFKNLSWAFQGCTNMTSAAADGGGSTIANVVSLQNTFWGCSVFDGPIGNWNIGNVQTLYLTFSRTPFNQDISTWDTKNVTDMTGVFYINSVFNRDISAWNLSKTRSTSYMFCASSAFNQNIAAWDVGNVINMVGMFYNSSAFNQNIAAWDVGNVINMVGMFYNSSAFNQNIAAWDVGNVIN
ncbi:MAG TPA: BspA family leucine-rich repeat surface protein, partial [Candidatus Competibacteraceae bacterium]|nr:BspA family leucine-rich repeat surface protein [Candidatus Competibacteraceae bacterium]